ncbi:unnamed protein product [Cylindrotheca closterium]|uniref:Uncharacterized protein n=1 Tax=Cylindrotheca closterium TaxID=2856 RepID=A0AAD2FW82_9STRA|nr:unnamed protein product [Cylindrotheca closterium]
MTPTASDDEIIEHVPRWKLFQNQKHSLRIPVSEIASCVGFHEYRDLVQLALRQVYQGSAGQELLAHDSKLLGLRLESDEQLLMEIAEQAGKETKEAWKAVVQVKHGVRKEQSVEQAQTLSKAVVQKAKESKKLTRSQIQQLEQASKHSVNTGFGTCWEDQALDMYEKQFGYEVRARNEEIKIWPFVRVDGGDTVRPLKDPHSHRQLTLLNAAGIAEDEPEPKRQRNSDSDEMDKKFGLISTRNISIKKQKECLFSLRGAIDGIRDELVPNSCMTTSDDDDSWVLQPIIVECKHRMNRLQPSPPLYEMIQIAAYCKMYDAKDADLLQVLRKKKLTIQRRAKDNQTKPALPDENFRQQKLPFVATSDKENNDKENDKAEPNSKPTDQSVVDMTGNCENEEACPNINGSMQQKSEEDEKESSGVFDTTELSEEIGDGAAEESVQVDEESSIKREPVGLATEKVQTEAKHSITIGTNETLNEDSAREEDPGTDKQDAMTMEISVTRMSMDDPRYQLNDNWESLILPRLKSWVEGIYEIRSSDDKRYRLLMASTESSVAVIGDHDEDVLEQQSLQQLRDAWNILFEECPWLVDCDTQYSREIMSRIAE